VSEVKEWREGYVTKKLLDRIAVDRMDALETMVNAENKDDACGIVKGITQIYNLIYGLEEGDLGAD
jgi:hypothetical protein